jgi:hypothetical protein
MFKKWDRTGKAKAIFLAIVTLPNLIIPISSAGPKGLLNILMPMIFAIILIPLITKHYVRGTKRIIQPDWNDSPFSFKKPISNFQFFAYFFLLVGLSMLIGSGIKYQTLNNFGLTNVSFSTGIFIGMKLALKMFK